MSRKSEVYTWRVSPEIKAHLEEAARGANRSVAQLLDEIVTEHLRSGDRDGESEIEQQRRLHSRAARVLGSISGGVPRRSERARELVRARLKRRRGARAH